MSGEEIKISKEKITQEIKRRRTFAIISHPDAGKTTLTEKFLLFGGAINTAGSVKGKKTDKHAVSDWMDIEKERGISVTSSVLQFFHRNICVNLLDTPGHQDFSEDTYRTLMAADSAVMILDASRGVEAQTIKLFKVCVMRNIPIFTFINKMDREAKNPLALLEEIEEVLGIQTCPMNWPIGSGKDFHGVYDRKTKQILQFSTQPMGEALEKQLQEDIELLDGASEEFDQEKVNKGKLSPVFFGSALTNFGVETFLNYFLDLAPIPLPRSSSAGLIDPIQEDFSAFVFKIQANMNKTHRDRIAFLRLCSGVCLPGMEVYHVQGKKRIRLSQARQLLANERKTMEGPSYAGDIIGVFDPGIFSIGDTLTLSNSGFVFEGIPTFAPEHFARVRQIDTMKRKQFVKGIEQIAQEGAIQIFQEFHGGMEEVLVGVVGTLQFDVLIHRLRQEYKVEVKLENLPYETIRWVDKSPVPIDELQGTSDMKKIKDLKGNPLLLFIHSWSVDMVLERNKGLHLEEFSRS
ncbi:peptide chain release factor 3 [Clostridia bacterium]|nr:peptide chain release factor 3 [Clostridia bacterium]